jgi:hypothetical protein
MTTTTTPQTTPATRSRAGLPFAVLAAILGLAYAALNAYWAAGGDRWLDKYGSHLIGEVSDRTTFRTTSAVLAVLFVIAVVLGLAATTARFDSGSRRAIRWLAWVAAGLITLYGLSMTAIGLFVQFDVADLKTGTPELYRWHAYLWDPWFLVWGLLMVAALLASARAYTTATGRDPVSDRPTRPANRPVS